MISLSFTDPNDIVRIEIEGHPFYVSARQLLQFQGQSAPDMVPTEDNSVQVGDGITPPAPNITFGESHLTPAGAGVMEWIRRKQEEEKYAKAQEININVTPAPKPPIGVSLKSRAARTCEELLAGKWNHEH